MDRPWLRALEDFRHPDLRAWALENRGDLIWAALVLIQAWIDQGRPPGKVTLGSYESWARIVELRKDLQRSDWTGELSTDQLRYAARDALVLLPLYERLVDELTRAGMVSVAMLEMEALPCVVWLRLTGAPFDQDAWRTLSDGAVHEQIELEQQLTAASGAADLFGGRALNWASVPQVLKVLRARGHEVPSTREEVLHSLAEAGDAVAALLLRYREASKRVGTYWGPMGLATCSTFISGLGAFMPTTTRSARQRVALYRLAVTVAHRVTLRQAAGAG
jgi:hypothetical protein